MEKKGNLILGSFSLVEDFYEGKSVFITGGTGFLGKVLIEKLLRSCEKIDKIYILIREKKNLSMEDRINVLTKDILFEKLKTIRPEILKKLVPVAGDLFESKLVRSDNQYNEIIQNVSVVFHLAAAVRFDEPLSGYLKINVEGTQKVLELCHKIKNITAFVHVSTAYSNTDKQVIEERVYPAPVPLHKFYAFLETHGDDNEECMKFIKDRASSYTFTKALAESEVLKAHGNIPTCIIRPSIVTPIWKEPEAGWLENWYGLTGIMFGISKGHLRCLRGCGSKVIDLIPVDMVANMIIVAATKCEGSTLRVYNCCSGSSNPLTFGEVVENSTEISVRNKWNDFIWPMTWFINSGLVVKILQVLFHLVPAYIMDAFCLLTKRRPRYVKTIKRYNTIIQIVDYFIANSWQFKDDNFRELITSTSKSDRDTFYCDPTEINWKSYFYDYLSGIYKHLLKTPVKSENDIR